jgi:hypothetical protein
MTSNSRRGFAKTLGVASVGIGAFFAKVETAQAAVTDADILQFALNLEYLEAEFYTVGMTGKTIDTMGVSITGQGNSGTTTGGQQVNFFNNSTLAVTVNQIGMDERAHVTLLQGALTSLGVMPIAKPAINLNALGTGFESPEAFLALARAFEDTGVSAYGGAAPLISSNAILATAARILATEALHTGNIRLHVALYQAATKALDGADSLPPPSGSKYFATNAMGLTPVRTTGQVLNIVYGGAVGVTQGGFFPSGVNGNINTSTSPATSN